MEKRPIAIIVRSQYGIELRNILASQDVPSSTLVVLFGGAGYPVDAPLFHYARKVALAHDCDLLKLEYGYNVLRIPLAAKDYEKLINDSLDAVRQGMERGYRRILFISKSLGTYVAGEVAKAVGYDRIQHLFLTPILSAMPHMMASSGTIIVGTNDGFAVKERIEALENSPQLTVHLIEHANHALEVEDPIGSLRILAQVTQIYDVLIQSFRD